MRGVRAYASVTDIPDDVDLAVVAVPAAGIDDVLGLLPRQGRHGARRGERRVRARPGPDGRRGRAAARRRRPARTACGWSGPTRSAWPTPTPTVRLNATLAPELPGRGRVGFFCQSGALGIAILAAAAQARPRAVDVRLGGQPRRPVGQRPAAVLGDRPGHRRRAAVPGDVRQPAQVRPGGPAARPHQADRRGEERAAHAPGRGARRAHRADRRRQRRARCSTRPASSGSTRSPSCSTSRCCWPTSRCPPGRGSRSSATPPRSGVLVADALRGGGAAARGRPGRHRRHRLAGGVRRRRRRRARRRGGRGRRRAVPTRSSPCSCRRSRRRATAYARALREAVAGIQASADKPVVATFLAAEGVPAELAVPGEDGTPGRGSVPSYASPERAAAALARVSRYARWRAEPAGDFTPPPGIDGDAARALVARCERVAPRPRRCDGGEPGRARRRCGERVLADDGGRRAAGLLRHHARRVAAGGGRGRDRGRRRGAGLPRRGEGRRRPWRHRTDRVGVRLDVVTPDRGAPRATPT